MQALTVFLSTMVRLTAGVLAAMAAALSLSGCDSGLDAVPGLDLRTSAQPRTLAVLTGRVVGITDGDTLTLLDPSNQQLTIRLAEIDAPERSQPWGRQAQRTLSDLAFGKSASVQQTDTDRYGRIVGRVFVEGQDVNRAMVEAGAAWAFRRYLTDETLLATEERARRSGVGLWSVTQQEPVPPWEWWGGSRSASQPLNRQEAASRPQALLSPRGSAAGDADFRCEGKRYCRQMTSCAEANFYLRQCGVSSLDGNGDGQPCEVLCQTARTR